MSLAESISETVLLYMRRIIIFYFFVADKNNQMPEMKFLIFPKEKKTTLKETNFND